MKAIFDKACEEVSTISGNPQIKEKFFFLTQRKWLESLSIEKFPAYDDFKHLGLTPLIERFLLRGILNGTDEIWAWQHLTYKCAEAGYPFAGFAVWMLADLLFQKREKLDNFYKFDDTVKRPYSRFFRDLMASDADAYKLFAQLKPHMPIDDENYSEHLRAVSQAMGAGLPDAPQEDTPQPSPVVAVENKAETTVAVAMAAPAEKNPLLDHPLFGSFLLPVTLENLCKVIIDGKMPENKLYKMFADSSGIYAWRHRFIKNLAILSWLIEKQRAEAAANVLKSLWELVCLMGARDRKEITLDAPQDIILAQWEPGLYMGLVNLTIEAFDKFESFKVNKYEIVTSKVKLSKESMDKLQGHQFMLGFFNS